MIAVELAGLLVSVLALAAVASWVIAGRFADHR